MTQHRVATPKMASGRQRPLQYGGHLGEVPCGPPVIPIALEESIAQHGNRLFSSPDCSPQFSLCLTIVFLLQLAAGILGFIFSDKVALGAKGPPQV